HSTLGGMLLAREDLNAQHPASRPRLTPRGAARRTLLELCNGERSIAQIERELQQRHPDLFSSAGSAQAFVAEVVTAYGKVELSTCTAGVSCSMSRHSGRRVQTGSTSGRPRVERPGCAPNGRPPGTGSATKAAPTSSSIWPRTRSCASRATARTPCAATFC